MKRRKGDEPTININMGAPCTACGRKGATPSVDLSRCDEVEILRIEVNGVPVLVVPWNGGRSDAPDAG